MPVDAILKRNDKELVNVLLLEYVSERDLGRNVFVVLENEEETNHLSQAAS